MLKKYQEFTRTTAIYPQSRSLEYLALGLTSEAGEVAGKVKKYIRDGTIDNTAVLAEVSDVFWYLSEICNFYNVTIDEVLQLNMDKLTSRKERGVIGGSGDTR
jgi:NTP pyrophosphatase (non-canonical NTP hydrolase)